MKNNKSNVRKLTKKKEENDILDDNRHAFKP